MKKVIIIITLILLVAACTSQQSIQPPVPTEAAPESLKPLQQAQPPEPTGVETTNKALTFDLSIENANPLDFDPAGPFYHTLYRTASADGLSFSGKDKIFEHTSVPDIIRNACMQIGR